MLFELLKIGKNVAEFSNYIKRFNSSMIYDCYDSLSNQLAAAQIDFEDISNARCGVLTKISFVNLHLL